ncbi:MAG: heme o synthase [Nitriliruptoraceae bacterium]
MAMSSAAAETAVVTSSAASAATWRDAVADYTSLTKPRIIELLLVTTVPAMFVAARGWPGTGLLVATLAGGALVSGSAHAFNMVIDRDIDGMMARTRNRPMPSGRISVQSALQFATVLLVLGTTILAAFAGMLATALTVVAWAWYVVIYTLLLKRRTPQNIVIGGVAGALPPMIGWAAVTGSIAMPAVIMFAVVVLWTPTHFWALAIGTGQDYANANVPMLPVLRGAHAAGRQAAVYAALTVAASFTLLAAGLSSPIFAVLLVLFGTVFVGYALLFARSISCKRAWVLFHLSNGYLALVFAAIAAVGLLHEW